MLRASGALIALALLSGSARATADDLRTVAAMQFHNRVLLVFAPALDDPRLDGQRKVMAHFAAGALTRDLLLVQVGGNKVIGAHDRADKLRRKFDTPPDRYRTLLIGKDGKVALDLAGTIDEGRLQATIDTMPMRREEIRRARAGLGKAG